MKEGIHPVYTDIVFQDVATGKLFPTRSTLKVKVKTTVEGKEVALLKVEVSSSSHPFFTGQQKFADREGRVNKYMNRYGKKPDEQKNSSAAAAN